MLRYLAVSFLILLSTAAVAADKSHPRSLDSDLKIQLFAEQPTIVTPTGIDVDYKGRVFAVESNTHFRPKGYKRHPSDRVLVLQDTNGDGKADKVNVFTDGLKFTMSVKVKPLWLDFQPKPTTPSSQRRRSRQLGLSVYVATRSDIWLYHDDNGDLKADRRDHIIHLETKGNYPHNGLAGMAFDAMGWMYFGLGENLGAKYTISGSDGTKFSGGGEGGNVYRCRPDGSKLSRWATGFWNPHASCVDAFGRLFTVDNDPDSRPPCRLLHVIEGGDYGYRFRNGRAGLHPFTAWNGEIPGTLPMVSGTGEAPSGIVAYESDGLPRKYIGNLLVGSWGDHRIDRFVLQPKGASFVSRPEPLIQGGEDFRPVGLAVAPDGSVFCTDWVKRDYNLHGHGRVWRISRKTPTRRATNPTSRARQEAGTTRRERKTNEATRKHPLPDGRGSLGKGVIDLSTITPKRPVKELTALLSHPRLEVRRMAARALLASKDKGWSTISDVMVSPKASARAKAECLRLAAMSKDIETYVIDRQVLADMPTMDRGLFDVLLTVWSHMLGKEKKEVVSKFDSPFLKNLIDPSHAADDVRFKRRLQGTISWIPLHKSMNWDARVGKAGETTRKAVTALATEGDPFQIAAMITVLRKAKSDHFLDAVLNSKNPSPRLYLLALLAKRAKDPKDTEHLRVALKSESPDVRRVAVQWVAEEHLKELKPQVQAVLNGKVMNADLFLATLAALEMLDGKRPQDFDKTPAGRYVLPLVKDPNRPAAVRAVALRLVDPDEPSLSEKLFKQMLAAKDAKLKTEAVRTLQQSQRPFAGKLLAAIALDAKNSATLRADAVAGLSGRSVDDPKTTQALLRLVAAADKSLRLEAFRSFRNHLMKSAAGRPVRMLLIRKIGNALKRDPAALTKDDALRRTAETLAAGYREAGISLPMELRGVSKLRPKTLAEWYSTAKPQAGKDTGNADAGRRVFFASNGATCFRCHTVDGRGGNIGPDLTYIARTASRRKLAESILEPSKEIAPQFTLWSFVMDDGKVHHGVILGDTRDGKRQRIGTPEGKIVDLPLNRIELRTPQKKSAMPDKLIDRLTASEFRDLLAFLETLK
jgi:putative membrane-bound dehydrogenase-like protein